LVFAWGGVDERVFLLRKETKDMDELRWIRFYADGVVEDYIGHALCVAPPPPYRIIVHKGKGDGKHFSGMVLAGVVDCWIVAGGAVTWGAEVILLRAEVAVALVPVVKTEEAILEDSPLYLFGPWSGRCCCCSWSVCCQWWQQILFTQKPVFQTKI